MTSVAGQTTTAPELGPAGWVRGTTPVRRRAVRDAPVGALIKAVVAMFVAEAMAYVVGLKIGPSMGIWIAITVGIGLVALSVFAWKRARALRAAVTYIVVVVAITAGFTWLVVSYPLGLGVPGYLVHAPGAAATAQARLLSTSTHETCVTVRHDPLHILPTPYIRCTGAMGGGQVDYTMNWGAKQPAQESGFVFNLGASEPNDPDSCLRHLSGSWWAYMSFGDPESPCPFSFELHGAP